MDNIFPKIKELAMAIIANDFIRTRFALVKAGQRSGKSILPYVLINLLTLRSDIRLTNVIFIIRHNEPLMPLPEGITCTFYTPEEFQALTEDIATDTLVIYDDAFHYEGSFDIIEDLRKYCLVLVVGSRGPEYDADQRWQFVPGYSFGTWDLNPKVQASTYFGAETQRMLHHFGAF